MFYETKDSKSEYIYGGRFQKLDSLLAAAASVYFNRGIPTHVPSKINATPVLDARSFVVPTIEDAYDVFLWRQLDATKNAVSMAAHSYFSHKSLHGMNSKQMQERLFAEKGINFNDYPYFFKRGTFVANESKTVTLTEDQLNAIPEKYRTNAKTCVRTVTTAFDMWLSSRPDQEDLSNFFYTIYRKD